MQTVLSQAKKAKQASKILRQATSEQKNTFLTLLASLIKENVSIILRENQKDIDENAQITSAMQKRLRISESALRAMVQSIQGLVFFRDPVGQVVKESFGKDNLLIKKVRVPIGVISCIFESRPNVIVDVATLCIKSGNAVIVRGGKEAIHSNTVLLSLIEKALEQAGLPKESVQQLEDRRYEAIHELVALDEYLDLVIPRGREELIQSVSSHSRVPVMKHVRGLCHAYIDTFADIKKAIKIIINAKTSNPATCNSIETVLVHKDIANTVMPELLEALFSKNVDVRGDVLTCGYSAKCKLATEEDWSSEYLDLIVSIKIVASFNEAIEHIEKYSSGLTDSIITEDSEIAEKFQKQVDSATVLINASNRLTDGNEFGLGGEIGISTSRIHVRGPMGLEDLTVTRYIVIGTGHIR
jgi:glutamate-5-semialdehyde dehydrogenase